MIQFQDVSHEYSNSVYGVKNIDLTINNGEFIFIVGPNGSGKTTLTKLITREEKLMSGKLTVNGFDLGKIKERQVPKLRRSLGVVFQDFKLFEQKTVYENVAFAMRVIGAHPALIRKRVNGVLSIVGLEDKLKAFPSELSGGERQRAAFARAIVNNPQTIIADEPTGNIDREMSFELMDLLTAFNKELNKTVIVITHDDELVKLYSKRVIKMSDGCIISDTVGGNVDDK